MASLRVHPDAIWRSLPLWRYTVKAVWGCRDAVSKAHTVLTLRYSLSIIKCVICLCHLIVDGEPG